MPNRLLMCAPEFFGVQYTINPWMKSRVGTVNHLRAKQQWNDFYTALEQHADIELIPPRPNVPDLVFAANSGLQLGNRVILSRFRHRERQAEEPFFREWFESSGYEVIEMDDSIFFEGAGDTLFQPNRGFLWAGYGFRSDPEAHDFIAKKLKVKIIVLRLIDQRFYHLDTCFCPLPNDRVMYYPDAFDEKSLKLIEKNTLPENRITVSTEDAFNFACNTVVLGNTLFMNHASDRLRNLLSQLGYTVCLQPMTEFMKAGGANKCLTLDLTDFPKVRSAREKPSADSREHSSPMRGPSHL